MKSLFKSLISVFKDIYQFFNPFKKKGVIRLVALITLIGAAFYFLRGDASVEETTEQLRTVPVATVAELSSNANFSLLGTVKSVSQANLLAEASGRVTQVRATLGQTVGAGTVLVELENRSEYASLLQAQGSYEAALAAAAQSEVSVEQATLAVNNAKQDLADLYRSAFTTTRTIVNGTFENFYNPFSLNSYGLKINGGASTDFLRSERVAFDDLLESWQPKTAALNASGDVLSGASEARANLVRLRTVIDVLIERTTETDASSRFTDAELITLLSLLESDGATVSSLISTIDDTVSGYESSVEALEQAKLGGTNEDLSAANAQVKQALGTLRAAEANYQKTIIRTPIAGTVNELSVDVGDFLGMQDRVALVANNEALEVTVFVGERDRNRMSVGQKVVVDGGIDGTVTEIAPAIDSVTRKFEVKVAAESDALTNGDSVSVVVLDAENESTEEQVILVPITAIKFAVTDGSVFTVENNRLVSRPVVIGPVRGSFVEVVEGISAIDSIVVDARGLTVGQEVEAIAN